jgi:hypothetical protein
VVVVGGTDGVFIFPTVQYTHHHHHHHPIINSCSNTIQNRKSPDDGPLDKIRIPPKNDTPQTPHMFANTHHPSWPSVGNSRSDEGDVTEEIDDDGFITVRTKREKRAIKYSNAVQRNRSESKNCKSVSRAILLKQSS